MRLPRSILPKYPYPGLRPFEKKEWPIFRGRDSMTEEIIGRLGAHHLVAVHGASGCGKSSLIRAGVISTLERKHARMGVPWQSASMRPGARPMWALAEALNEALRPLASQDQPAVREVRGILGRGSDGILQLLAELEFPAEHNFLLLVDQFEELFRYRRLADSEAGAAAEAQSFVERLLHVATRRPEGVYIVTTMRSDYLGDCAQYEGLPEVLNKSQYLVPRMTPEQIEEAIARPPELYGGQIDQALVKRLIKDMRGDPDHLPLLQHALLLMWVRAHTRGGAAPTAERIRLSLADYTCPEVGDLYRALSNHGDEVLRGLELEQQRVAEVLFRRLVEIDRETRRATSCGTVSRLANVGLARLEPVVDAFRQPEVCFLDVRDKELTEETSLELSHESLIRQWQTLKEWRTKEVDSARIYRRLCEAAEPGTRIREGLWSSARVYVAREWEDREHPTALWARRYPGDFASAMTFLKESASDADQRRERAIKGQRRAILLKTAVVFLVILFVGGVLTGSYIHSQNTQLTQLRKLIEQTNIVYRAFAAAAQHDVRFVGLAANELKRNVLYELLATLALLDEISTGMTSDIDEASILKEHADPFIRQYHLATRLAIQEAIKALQQRLESTTWMVMTADRSTVDVELPVSSGLTCQDNGYNVDRTPARSDIDRVFSKDGTTVGRTFNHKLLSDKVINVYRSKDQTDLWLGVGNLSNCSVRLIQSFPENTKCDRYFSFILVPSQDEPDQATLIRYRWFPRCDEQTDAGCGQMNLGYELEGGNLIRGSSIQAVRTPSDIWISSDWVKQNHTLSCGRYGVTI